MGRIKTKLTKRTANEILKLHRKKFSTEFQHNKKALDELVEMPSKKIRNVVVGYITRLVRAEQENK